MTAENFAELVYARRSGPARWMARCPAHADHSPSLSITAGRDGRVLVRCFAGCSLGAILRSAGLTIQDLFQGPAPAPEKLAAAAVERNRKRDADQTLRAQERDAIDWLRVRREELERDLPRLGRQLTLLPEGSPGAQGLTEYFHASLRELRVIDRVFEGEFERHL
jgi:hypothetical protein